MNITTKRFGQFEGEEVLAYTLENDLGMKLTCLNLGCIVTEIITPDQNGNLENVVLGFDNVEDYLKNKSYFGAIVGRVAGRISRSEFELNGKNYQLNANEGLNHLHGGLKGLNERLWETNLINEDDYVGVQFTYRSKDGEEGYPGNLDISVTYSLNNKNEWTASYTGTTDMATLLNMTNHSYFNLTGNLKNTIVNHQLKINSSQFLELKDELLPTGELLDVSGTVFDFRNGRPVIEGIVSQHPQNLLAGKGYDHPFVLDHNEIELACPDSGRVLNIVTDQPCVVFYSGNQLDGNDFSFKEGVKTRNYLGMCLETQGFPDAIHHSHFPSIVLKPNESYKAETTYKFSVR